VNNESSVRTAMKKLE